MIKDVRLTQYSHGSGCGCKISPMVLEEILSEKQHEMRDINLLVGNDTKDDAAVYKLDEKTAIISTTDFFMPIVDDPFDFGAIAATNAISDIYAMGGTPIMAISILGWPIDKLPASVAKEVINGARSICKKASISLAGGHSIDAPEPIFGLAVTGKANPRTIKRNNKARIGSQLYLTKPLGIGILTTAQKKGILKEDDLSLAKNLMLTLNDLGSDLGKIDAVSALTDVTGFGLLGHLIEICEGSAVSAIVEVDKVPIIPSVQSYLKEKCIPGGTNRNYESYGNKIASISDNQKHILCDPQTSGGLLVAVDKAKTSEIEDLFNDRNLDLKPFGEIIPKREFLIELQ